MPKFDFRLDDMGTVWLLTEAAIQLTGCDEKKAETAACLAFASFMSEKISQDTARRMLRQTVELARH